MWRSDLVQIIHKIRSENGKVETRRAFPEVKSGAKRWKTVEPINKKDPVHVNQNEYFGLVVYIQSLTL